MSIHEGKNISDTIGSIAKGAFNRGKAKKDVGISGISQVVQIIRENFHSLLWKKWSRVEGQKKATKSLVAYPYLESASSYTFTLTVRVQ